MTKKHAKRLSKPLSMVSIKALLETLNIQTSETVASFAIALKTGTDKKTGNPIYEVLAFFKGEPDARKARRILRSIMYKCMGEDNYPSLSVVSVKELEMI